MINLVIFLCSLIVFTFGAGTLGAILLRLFGLRSQPVYSALAWGSGVSAVTITLTFLGLCELFHSRYLFWVWTFLLILGAGYLLWSMRLIRSERIQAERHPDWILIISQIGTFVLLTLCFLTVMTPESRHDPYDYHLMIPILYLMEGKITEIPWHVFSYMPKNTEMLYGLALSVSNDSVAKLIHFLFGVFGVMIVCDWARLGLKRTGCWLAVFLIATLPLFGFIATSAYVDLALGFWQLLSLYCLAKIWDEQNVVNPKLLLCLSAWFAGMALGTKYTAIVVFLPGYLICLFASIQKISTYKIVSLILALIIVPLPFLPWMVLNFVWTLNPVYPLLPHVFGYHTPAAQAAYAFFRGHAPSLEVFEFGNFMPFLWMRFNRLMLDGNALFLIGISAVLFYPLFAKSKEDFRRVPFQGGLIAFVVLSSTAFFIATDNHDGRFFYATLALLAIPTAQLLLLLHQNAVERSAAGRMLVPLFLLFFFVNDISYRFSQLNDQRETFFPVLTEEQRKVWLRNRFPDYPLIEWANDHLPQDAVVLGMGYPLRREFIAKNKFGYIPGLEDGLRSLEPAAIVHQLKEAGVTHFVEPNDFFELPEDYRSNELNVLFQHRGKFVYQIKPKPFFKPANARE